VSGRPPATVPLALLLAAALGGCGVKAPPRASGAPERAPPNELFRSRADLARPGADLPGSEQGADLIRSEQGVVQPADPAPTTSEEPSR